MRESIELTPEQVCLVREALAEKLKQTKDDYGLNSLEYRNMEKLWNLFPHRNHITLED